MANLTASEVQVLRELEGAPDNKLRYSTLLNAGRQAAKLTPRGMSTVLGRLERRNLVTRNYGDLHLSFAGWRALQAAEQVSA